MVYRPFPANRCLSFSIAAMAWLSFIGIPLTADDVPSSKPAALRDQPLSPAASLAQLEWQGVPATEIPADAGAVRLLATEPLTIDPVEVQLDGSGRLWIVEMRDYPFQSTETPRGRVRVLQDTDGDAVFDQATTFAEGLSMPTGLAVWKDGAVVTLEGELCFLRDKDGDGRADAREQWLRGFKVDNEQLRANHPRLGPDGWWYIACGLRGGSIQLGSHFDPPPSNSTREPLQVGSRDLRFDPRSGRVEPVTGPAQFGLTFDRYGSRLFCSNRNPAVQVVLEQADLQDNPLAGLVPSVIDVLPAGAASRVFPLVEAWTTSNLHAGQFTAACGVTIAPAGSEQAIFVCEPTGSLVQRGGVTRGAANLQLAGAGETGPEWLASRDPWFRPVNLSPAPGSGLFVVDMHRAVIEHPQWVPEELKQRPDERWGEQAGRIYLVTQDAAIFADTLRNLQLQPLHQRDSSALVELVSHSDPWMRGTAGRLLIQRELTADTPLVQRLWELARDPSLATDARCDCARLAQTIAPKAPDWQVLCLDAETPEALCLSVLRQARAVEGIEPSATTNLVRLCEQSASEAVLFEALLCLARTPGRPEDLPAGVIERLVKQDQPHLLIAAAGVLREHPERLFVEWLSAFATHHASPPTTDAGSGASRPLPRIAGDTAELLVAALLKRERNHTAARRLVAEQLAAPSSLAGLYVAIRSQSAFASKLGKVAFEHTPDDLWHSLQQVANTNSQPLESRLAALRLLGFADQPEVQDWLLETAERTHQPELKAQLLQARARSWDDVFAGSVLELLQDGLPHEQRTAANLLLQDAERLPPVADAIRTGAIDPRRLGPAQLKSLAERAAGETRQIFSDALAQLVDQDRLAVLERYQAALSLPGDRQNGQQVFAKHCAACHRIGTLGVDVGPDISDSRTKQPSQLLTSILDPNRIIDNNYFQFSVLTIDDQVLEGIIAEETEDAIVLRGQQNRRSVIPRDEIVQLKASGVSLMPEGLESQVSVQEMADLITFIKDWRYESGLIPGK